MPVSPVFYLHLFIVSALAAYSTPDRDSIPAEEGGHETMIRTIGTEYHQTNAGHSGCSAVNWFNK